MQAQWFIAFGLVWLVHLALFGMQRATLLISQNAGVQWKRGGELLLPRWYPVTWLVIVGKWGLLVAMAILWDWKIALGLAIGGYILSVVTPIPFRVYKGVFRQRVNQLMHQDPVLATQLREMLDSAPF